MTQRVYDELADALSLRGGSVPVLRCKEFLALLEELFTPEEAELAARMPIGLTTVKSLASETRAVVLRKWRLSWRLWPIRGLPLLPRGMG